MSCKDKNLIQVKKYNYLKSLDITMYPLVKLERDVDYFLHRSMEENSSLSQVQIIILIAFSQTRSYSHQKVL